MRCILSQIHPHKIITSFPCSFTFSDLCPHTEFKNSLNHGLGDTSVFYFKIFLCELHTASQDKGHRVFHYLDTP